jgi:hypothetical protein
VTDIAKKVTALKQVTDSSKTSDRRAKTHPTITFDK